MNMVVHRISVVKVGSSRTVIKLTQVATFVREWRRNRVFSDVEARDWRKSGQFTDNSVNANQKLGFFVIGSNLRN